MVRITKHGKFNEFESTECPEKILLLLYFIQSKLNPVINGHAFTF